MVGVAGQPSGGSTLPASRSDYVGCDGCLQGGLGRPPWRLGGLRALVKSLGQATHQLARASSGLANPEAFHTSVAGHCCGCHFRQYHHSCLYQQGGRTQSPSLCRLALDVWEWCRQHEIFLVASHLSGDRNVLADALSRGIHRHPTEWTLHNAVTSAIFQRWPTPHVDLFASEKNHKLPVFFSIRPSPSSSGVNALTQNWDCLYGYAYPPTALIPRVLRKLRLQPTAQILLVAPFWPSQPWFCQMTSMLTDLPRAISQRDDLLKNAVTGMRYPKPEAMRLTVWPRKSFVDHGFSANVADTAARARRESTRRVYGSRLKHYQKWCVDRGVDPVKAPLTEVAEFLENLRTVRHKGNPLAPSTFAGYRSAIAAIHQGFSDGSTVSSNTDLSTLLKGIFVVTAKPRTL